VITGGIDDRDAKDSSVFLSVAKTIGNGISDPTWLTSSSKLNW
jgi:hypothetical protein